MNDTTKGASAQVELLSCPFCGKTPDVVRHSYNYQLGDGPLLEGWVVDHECLPGHGNSRDAAILKWNTRA